MKILLGVILWVTISCVIIRACALNSISEEADRRWFEENGGTDE